jgi:DNA helicase-2/ATP-dependent DNA helicase PcrA
MIKSFQLDLKTKNAYELANHVAKSSGILPALYNARDDDEGVMRFENLEELLAGIKEFSETENDEVGASSLRTLDEFMQDVALHTDADDKNKDEKESVSLMTIHAAKGLEFPYVFIVGLEENLFPSMMAVNSRAEIEEERRLFYVALTRGEKQVFLSYSESRYKWGNLQYSEPSRFIYELDARFIDDQTSDMILSAEKAPKKKIGTEKINFPTKKPTLKPKKEATTKPNTPKNLKRINNMAKGASNNQANTIQVGMEVFHDRFGRGKVLTVEGVDDNKKASVFFNNSGTKNLLLKYAKLRILKE